MFSISEDARRMIAAAASHAGMSTGDWLNEVILEAAEREGISDLHEIFPARSDEPESVDFRPIFARLDQLAASIQTLSQEADDDAEAGPIRSGIPRRSRERAIFDQLSELLQIPNAR